MHAKYFSTVWGETRKYIVFELFSIAYMCKRITKCSHSVSIVFYTASKCFGTLPLTASHIKRESLRSVSLTARHVLSWWTLRAANSRGKNKLEEHSTSHRARVKIAYNDSDKKKTLNSRLMSIISEGLGSVRTYLASVARWLQHWQHT